MTRPASALLFALLLGVAEVAIAQEGTPPSKTTEAAAQQDDPIANPGRPTVSTPATLTPAGYLQFESGYLAAWHSAEFSSQSSFNEVVKFSICRRLELLAGAQPFAHSRVAEEGTNAAGDAALGVQGIVSEGEGARPTIALSYFRRVYSGAAPNLDIGSASNSALVLFSADVKGFHYDTNFLFSEAVEAGVRRAQFGQTLSISHSLPKKFGISGEIWDFTQPFLRGRAVGNLWAVNYNARRTLVLDCGFNRGLTGTSTRWEVFAGFTYLLPRRVPLH